MKNYLLQFVRKSWFWLVVGGFMMLFFVIKGHSAIEVFYFVCVLLPIVIGTSYYIREYLIPEYLIRKNYVAFTLKSLYTFIISLYLQYLFVFLAVFIFTLYQGDQNYKLSFRISTLNFILYIVILFKLLLEIIAQLNLKTSQLNNLAMVKEVKAKQNMLTVQYKRQKYPIDTSTIIFIESLSDYIKIVTTENEIICKERISKVLERLPENFLRSHRSFIVNRYKINTYNRLFIDLQGHQIPISRTYKKDLLEALEK